MNDLDVYVFNNYCLETIHKDAITTALSSVNPWDHKSFDNPVKKHLIAIKNKIKDYHLAKVNWKCCYCRRSLKDANIEQDREHIVPKSKSKVLSYHIFNISIACKRCNMTYKKESISHIVNIQEIESELMLADAYLIPHPNIDCYEDHLERISLERNGLQACAYKIHSCKGRYLYNFVNLQELCINEFDKAQGNKYTDEIAYFKSMLV